MSKRNDSLFTPERAARRKQPRQPRAEQTVSRIKHAMLELIAEEGYAAVSTNRVAKRARVNISSLYQYFPNRESIALAMYEDASSRQAQVVHDVMMATMAQPLESGIRRLLEVLVDFLDQEQMALMRLVDEIPELRQSAGAMSLENLAYHTSRVYLQQHLGMLDEGTMRRKLFFVQHMGMGLIRRYVLDKPPGIARAHFIAELAETLVMYLRKPAPAL